MAAGLTRGQGTPRQLCPTLQPAPLCLAALCHLAGGRSSSTWQGHLQVTQEQGESGKLPQPRS